MNNETNIYRLFSASFQGVKRLFVIAYDAADNNEVGIRKKTKKTFSTRTRIENYKVLINGRNFFDEPINDLIK